MSAVPAVGDDPKVNAAHVLAALRRHYGVEENPEWRNSPPGEWAALDEFSTAPGGGQRRCDLFVVRAWAGTPKGHERHAIEVKVTAQDLRAELADPTKAEASTAQTLAEPWWEIGDEYGPDIPLLHWDGRPVIWDSWDTAVVMTHGVSACEHCGHDPLHHARGVVHPLPGDTVPVEEARRLRSGRTWTQTVATPAWAVARLFAAYCPACRDLDVVRFDDDTVRISGDGVEAILCDGCDAPCAYGASLDEARATLAEIGGWSAGGDADWDLCPRCNPNRVDEPPRVTPLSGGGAYASVPK